MSMLFKWDVIENAIDSLSGLKINANQMKNNGHEVEAKKNGKFGDFKAIVWKNISKIRRNRCKNGRKSLGAPLPFTLTFVRVHGRYDTVKFGGN